MTKTRNKLKIMGLLLTLVMMVSLLGIFALTANAVESEATVTEYSLWVGGEQITSETLIVSGGEGTATYNPDTNTLTLNNYSYTGPGYGSVASSYAGIHYSDSDTLKLVLTGTNSVTQTSGNFSYGVYVVGNVDISGSGSLTANGGTASDLGYGGGQSTGIRATGDITISGGTLIATGGAASTDYGASSTGIEALNITISGGTVTAIGGTATNSYGNGSSYGVWANVAISGGEVIAQAEKSAFYIKPTIDPSFTDAAVWYGESKEAADTAGAQAISNLTSNYNQKYVRVAVGTAPTVASVTTTENVTTEYSDIQLAINAAQASSGSTLKLLDDVTTSSLTLITSGSFTIDLNGKTWQFDLSTQLYISGTETNITIIDTSTEGTGKLLGTNGITVIDAGGSSFTMSGGTIEGYIRYSDGKIDLSGYSNPMGIKIYNGKYGEDVIVSGTIILPNGYALLDATGNTADTLVNSEIYTVGVASTVTKYPLWVGGEQFDAEKPTISGTTGTATYDPSTNTLTLNDYTYSGAGYNGAAIYYSGSGTLNLVLEGDNNSVTHSGGENRYGLYAIGNVDISGSGSLTATGGTASTGNSYGVYTNGDVTISGGTVTATGGTASTGNSYGVYANGDVTISGGTVTATGGTASTGNSYGVYTNGDVTISGGTVTATGGTASTGSSYGVDVKGITITGGTVTATGGNATYSYGIDAFDVITITGGTVTATGGEGSNRSTGVRSIIGSLTVNGGKIKATASTGENSCGIEVYAGIFASGAVELYAKGEDYGISSESSYLGISKGDIHILAEGSRAVNSAYLQKGEGGTFSGYYRTDSSADFTLQESANQSEHQLVANDNTYSYLEYVSTDHMNAVAKINDTDHGCKCSVVTPIIEKHTGGNPTCTTSATCTACGTEYLNPNNHEYEKNNGICCDTYQPATLNESGYYEIGNAGQLFWFANHVNTVDRTASAVLVADIDLENRPWTPIGSTGEESNNFRGVFDGQNHTIKGLYVEGGRAGLGFFGEVRTGTVKNFTIYGEVVVNTEVDYVGGVIGSICGVNGETDLERNGAIIQNITSYVNLTAKAHGVGMIGGFVGYANHQSLIENCSWYGTFDAGIYRVDSGAGGFIGKIQENTSEVTIRNCAAYGTIKTNYAGDYNNTATIYMGGFLSFSNTGAKTTLENCLFAGKFERGENLTDQAFLGAFGTLRSVNAIKNCYYLGDGVLEAVHSNSDLKPGSDNVEITSVTKAQLLSGEVAYKLGEHFGQILEGENRQSYPVLGGTKVEDSQRFEIYGQQLNIGGDLSMKYYVMVYAPEFNSLGLYMEFSHNGVKTKVYADEPNADGFYVFVLEGINPQCMGDSIRAMLYYNETEVASHGCEDGKEYSVEKNLLNLLEKYKDDAALVTLIKDTLAYGEATSAYKKHQTMTGNTYTENSSNREIPVSEAQVADVITGYTVRFGTAISIIIEVNPSAFEDTIYKVECNGTELRNFPSPNSPLYKVTNIAATDFDKEWEFVVRSTNPMGDVYGTVVISVNDYLYGISQSSTDEKMVNLAKALYNYGVSAEIYNHVKTGEGDHYYVDNVCACGKLETIDATAMTAEELKAAVADQLAAGETDITVTLKPDAPAEMITAIRHAICDTEGIADGSINLTLKGVTTIPGTTNWDGVAFGPGDIYDEAGKIVDQELVTQLASINLPDVTEIGAQAFYFCENLVSVSAPKAQTIGAQALGYTALTSVEFPELTTIPTDMFSGTWTLSSAKFPKVTTIEQGGLLVGAKFTPENNPTPFPLELTAEGDITFNGSYHFNIAERNYSGKVDLVLNIDKKDQVTFHDDGTATWQVREDLSYTFKSITFVGE